MEKIVVMTIKPKHLHDMRTGRKDIELRKTMPQLVDFPFNVALCESGSGGKILAEFICDEAYNICPNYDAYMLAVYAQRACVRLDEMLEYMNGNSIYGLHVFDFIDYTRAKGHKVKHINDYGLSRPPQSWCYAKEG